MTKTREVILTAEEIDPGHLPARAGKVVLGLAHARRELRMGTAHKRPVRRGRLRAQTGSPRNYRTEASMDVNSPAGTLPSSRVLVVSDWRADPDGVISACRERTAAGGVAFARVVPAWLHALDGVGAPAGSRP